MATDDQDKAIREIAKRHGFNWTEPPSFVTLRKQIEIALCEAYDAGASWQGEQWIDRINRVGATCPYAYGPRNKYGMTLYNAFWEGVKQVKETISIILQSEKGDKG